MDVIGFDTPEPPRRRLEHWAHGAWWLIVIALVALGALERLYLLTHLPLFGDEAIVGLMARQIDHGHLYAFYWGQYYGGAEFYVAAFVRLISRGPVALSATATALSALGSVLVALIVSVVTRRRRLGVVVGAVSWVWPYALLWNSVRELGFRFAALDAGLMVLLFAVLFVRSRHRTLFGIALGLSLGLGWWASPEIAYFVPAAALCVFAAGRFGVRRPRPARWFELVTIVIATVVGALPWLIFNLRHHMISLRASSQPSSSHLSYAGRLAVFLRDDLPVQLGVRSVVSGSSPIGHTLGNVVVIVVVATVALALSAALMVAANGSDFVPLALTFSLMTLPFLFALNPASGYWSDGRYGVFLGPLLLIGVSTSASAGADWVSHHRPHVSHRVSWRVGVTVVAAAAAVSLTLANASSLDTPSPATPAFYRGWSNPDAAMVTVVNGLRAHDIHDAYGDYWVAYDLDFIAQGSIAISPSRYDVDRWPALAKQVAASRRPAWLFYAPAQAHAASAVFENPQPGPGAFTEHSFRAGLVAHGIKFKVFHLGVIDAVVPSLRIPADKFVAPSSKSG